MLFLSIGITSGADVRWGVNDYSNITSSATFASVNGNVTYDEKLTVRFIKGRCQLGNLYTTVFTYKKNPQLSELKNQRISINLGGENLQATILHIVKLEETAGHIATVEVGSIPKEALQENSKTTDMVKIVYVDSENFKISHYFDVLENNWNTENMSAAIEQASKACEAL